MSYKILEHLAQSFIVDTTSVLTKVDLYFSGKDSALPFYMHIVKNVNGFPGDVIIPFSETYVYPSQITTGDGSVASTIEFESPIHLEAGEYSLCFGTSSDDYKIYCSEVGAVDDLTDKVISVQPYVGTLFKSQTGSRWVPLDKEDLKFKMYRAKFDTTSSVNIDFKVDANSAPSISSLIVDPLEIYPSNTTVRVYHKDHNMTDGSYVRFYGVEGANTTLYGIDIDTFNANTSFTIGNVTDDSYTVTLSSNTSGITETTRFGGSSVYVTDNFRYDILTPAIATLKNPETTITQSYKKTSSSYSTDSSFTVMSDGDNLMTEPSIIAGTETKANNLSGAESLTYRLTLSTDNEYASPMLDMQQAALVATKNIINNPSYTTENVLDSDVITLVSANSLTITQSTSNTLFGTIAVPAVAQNTAITLVKGTHLTLSGGNNTGKFRIVSVADDGSTIDVENVAGSNTVTDTASYTITNGKQFIDDRAATGSTSKAQYITRQIDFKNPSTSLNIRLDVNRPAGSDIELYYRSKLVGEQTDLKTKEFIRIPHTMPVSLTSSFTEIESQLDNMKPFESLAFKIVMKSSDTTKIPKCKNFRLIALA